VRWAIAGVVACACGGGAAAKRAAPPPSEKRTEALQAAALPDGVVDEGAFEIEMKGKPVGRETFAVVRRGGRLVIETETRFAWAGVVRLFDSRLVTDLAWRPIEGTFRDVRDGVTIHDLGGEPLRMDETVAGVPSRTLTAAAAVDLYIGDNTMTHLAPLCAITGAATRIGFPAMTIAIGAAAGPRPGPGSGTVVRRDVDLGGATRAYVYCDGDELIGVEIPFTDVVATRTGRADDVAQVRPRTRVVAPLPDAVVELEREVEVRAARGVEAATLACALIVPAAAAERRDRRTPGVVLVTGSGPQDRDENAVGGGGVALGAFRTLAIALGQAGVASLRCDDRGTARSTGEFGTATLETFLADGAAMVAALRAERAIDRRRIGVLGHSEGGVIAPRLAVRDRRIRAIALLGAPGRPLDVVLLEQVARALDRAGTAGADRDAALARHRDAIEAIRADRALPDTAEARDWKGGEAWLRSHLARDPAATVAALGAIDVLVAQGDRDQQVTPADADALIVALRRADGRPRVTDRRYEELNHMFVATATGNISEYTDPDAVLDPRLIADVVAFFAAL
jgi:uncharacterized protein